MSFAKNYTHSIHSGHKDYANKMDIILRLLGIRTRDPVNKEDPRVKKSASDYPGFMSMHEKMVSKSCGFVFILYL